MHFSADTSNTRRLRRRKSRDDDMENHTHNLDIGLSPDACTILQQGLNKLLELTDGLSYLPLRSERDPYP